MNLLLPDKIKFEQTKDGTLNCILKNGEIYKNISCAPLFPLSDPDNFISINAKNNAKKKHNMPEEIGIIKHLKDLGSEQQKMLRHDIRIRYFMPEIKDIKKITKKPGIYEWHVITDRGEKNFFHRLSSENMTVTDKKIIIITDIERCRYKITNFLKLPSKARSELDRILL